MSRYPQYLDRRTPGGTARRDQYGRRLRGEYNQYNEPLGSEAAQRDTATQDARDAHWEKYFGGKSPMAAARGVVIGTEAPAAPEWDGASESGAGRFRGMAARNTPTDEMPVSRPRWMSNAVPVNAGAASNPRGVARAPVRVGPGIARGKAQYSDGEIAGELARTKTLLQPGAGGNDPTRANPHVSASMTPAFAGWGQAPLPRGKGLSEEYQTGPEQLAALRRFGTGSVSKGSSPTNTAGMPRIPLMAGQHPGNALAPSAPAGAAALPRAAAIPPAKPGGAHPMVMAGGVPAQVVQSSPTLPPGAARYTPQGQTMVNDAMTRKYAKLGVPGYDPASADARSMAGGHAPGTGTGDAMVSAATRQPSTIAGGYVERAQAAAGSLANMMRGSAGEGSPLFNGLQSMAPKPAEDPLALLRKLRKGSAVAPFKVAQTGQ